MMYAFARDGGIPGHKFFNNVSHKWKSPIRTGAFTFSSLHALAKLLPVSLAGVHVELYPRAA